METQIYQKTSSEYINKLKKTRLVGLLSIVQVVFVVLAIIMIIIGSTKQVETLYTNPSIYGSYVQSISEYSKYLAAFGGLLGIGLIFGFVVDILYMVMISKLKVDKFKLWIILLIVGFCVMPLLHFIAWIYTLVELKDMINKRK
ncbi:hypothetical protein [Ureaplasma zalophigenitalium]|uniref:DUF4064 domain-containing protein n=1 Tax=Ureaplasma zalophigenitalium TaxID=907723 RepID=A0ABT3BPC5_9BACT|nr:hypothetical protein [Ureaplasma zalophigenitalium]MCV3754112.1 hypothetical protein [Ureaplasma zalophigenitalium]